MFLLWQQWKYTYITLFQRIILLTFCCFDLNLIMNWNVEDNFKFTALPSTYLVLFLFVLGWLISFITKKAFWGWDTPLWSSSLSVVRVDGLVWGEGAWLMRLTSPEGETKALHTVTVSRQHFIQTVSSIVNKQVLFSKPPFSLLSFSQSLASMNKSKIVQLLFQRVLYCAERYS